VVTKRAGFESLTEHDIVSVVGEKLPHFKQLYGGVYFVEELPSNPSGKILRRMVREIAIKKHANRYKT
jgi:4-coumarate--CoA ligase